MIEVMRKNVYYDYILIAFTPKYVENIATFYDYSYVIALEMIQFQ